MENLKQIAIWGRDCLLSTSDLNKIIINAKIGDEAAKAALSILTHGELKFTDNGVLTPSLERSIEAVQNGIEPPYQIQYQITSKTIHTKNGLELTPTYDVTIDIDSQFNVRYSEPVKTVIETSLEDWLI